MTQLFTNNADSTLASGISNAATSMTVSTGDGAKFPTITGSDYFLVTLYQLSGINEFGWEIVKVTARSGDTFTIVRAQDGTSASAFSAGDKVSLRMTAAGAAGMAQKANNLSDLASASTARTNLGLGDAATHPATDFATAAQGTKADGAAQKANNLSDLASASSARTNLGLGSAATLASSAIAQTANNLSDLANAATARTNLGLGTAATLASSAVAQTANNLSDLASASTARTNLGLGTAATQASTAFATAAQGTKADNAVAKDGSVAMTAALEVDAAGGGSLGTAANRALVMKNGVGAVDGKGWSWSLERSGLDDQLVLSTLDDSGTAINEIWRITRTGAIRKTIELFGRVIANASDDGSTDVQCNTFAAGTSVSIGSGAAILAALGIGGDMSNATHANRFLFQTLTSNGNTAVGAIPNGTATIAQFLAYAAQDPNNASIIGVGTNIGGSNTVGINSSHTGTGVTRDIVFAFDGSEKARLATSGVASFSTSGLTGTIVLTDTGAAGANIRLTGNGATTPSKYLRATNGAFSVVNDAYGAEILNLSDAGVLTLPSASGAFKIGGNQILSARRTGWAAWSGTATRTSVSTLSATTAQCAQAIKALVDDLIAHGIIGA